MNNITTISAAMASALLLGGLTPAAAAVAPQQQGDWAVRCSGGGADQICDAVQSLIDKNGGQEKLRVAFARQKSTGHFGLQVKTPLGFRLDSGVLLQLDGNKNDNIDKLVFNRCLPEGCFAERPLAAAEFTRLQAAEAINVVFLTLKGEPVVLPISVKGLKLALGRL